MDVSELVEVDFNLEELLDQIRLLTVAINEETSEFIDEHYPDDMLAYLFKNKEKCHEVSSHLEKKIEPSNVDKYQDLVPAIQKDLFDGYQLGKTI